jgi:hypothetical protein
MPLGQGQQTGDSGGACMVATGFIAVDKILMRR